MNIVLMSEIHLLDKANLKIPGYQIYNSPNPSGRARSGVAIVIRQRIKHYTKYKYLSKHIQTVAITVYIENQPITISVVYCPPS